MIDHTGYSRDIFGDDFTIADCNLDTVCRKRCNQLDNQGFDTTDMPVRQQSDDTLVVKDGDGSYHGDNGDIYIISSPYYEMIEAGLCPAGFDNYLGLCTMCWDFTHDTGGGTITVAAAVDIDDGASCAEDFITVTGGTVSANNVCGLATTVMYSDTDTIQVCFESNQGGTNAGSGFQAAISYS